MIQRIQTIYLLLATIISSLGAYLAYNTNISETDPLAYTPFGLNGMIAFFALIGVLALKIEKDN